MPTAASSAAAATLQADAGHAASGFNSLSTATSVSQYQQRAAASGLQPLLARFDADYARLGTALGAG